MRRGQSWSMDIVIAVVIFGFVTLAIAGFVLLSQPDAEKLQQNSQVVITNLAAAQAGCGPILLGTELDHENLLCLFNYNYEEFKQENNIQGEFCMYLEDEEGRVWAINDTYGWGSSEIRVGNIACEENLT